MKSQIRGMILLFAVMLLSSNASATFEQASSHLREANTSLSLTWFYGYYDYATAAQQSAVEAITHLGNAFFFAPAGSYAAYFIGEAINNLNLVDTYIGYTLAGSDYSDAAVSSALLAQIYLGYAMEYCALGF